MSEKMSIPEPTLKTVANEELTVLHSEPNAPSDNSKEQKLRDSARKPYKSTEAPHEHTRKPHHYTKEQIARENRVSQRKNEFHKQIEELEREEFLRQAELEKNTQEQRKQKIAELKGKDEKRREEVEKLAKQGITQSKQVSKVVPLYKKYEEDYNTNVLLPELERKKAELAKKRMNYQPLSLSDLKEHARKYEELKQRTSHRHHSIQERSIEGKVYLSTLPKSSFRQTIIQEERQRLGQLETEKTRKLELAEKQRKYATLVKEMFPPKLDLVKEKEMDLIKEKLDCKRPKQVHRLLGSSPLTQKKWKQNPLVPPSPSPAKKEPIHLDYLATRRVLRDAAPPSERDKAQSLIQRKNQLEREAHKCEVILQTATSVSLQTIKQQEELNGILLSSVKTKIELLHSNNSDS